MYLFHATVNFGYTILCVVCLQRYSGGVAVGPQTHLAGVVHPQQQYYPSQPLYIQDIPLQEVPNGHDVCPTGKKWKQFDLNYGTRYWKKRQYAYSVIVNTPSL